MGLTVASLAITCFVLLGAGYLVFFALARVPSMAPTIKDAFPILHTEALIVGCAAGAFWIGGWFLAIALLLLTARTAFEAASVVSQRARLAPPLAFGVANPALAFAASYLPLGLLCALVLGGMIASIAARAARVSDDTRTNAALDLTIFPTLPLILFTAAGLQGTHGVWLLAAFILAETFDSYALLGGKLFGKRKAFPTLSPNKTMEGLAIGAAMLMLTAALVGALLGGLPFLTCAAVALFAGALTLAGDLTASRLKRLSGVKDYPGLIAHQGGLLDITDAWIVTGAGLVCLAVLVGAG